MADIHWQDLCKKIKADGTEGSEKLIQQTVRIYYSALVSSITPDCEVVIWNIGKFKGSSVGVKRMARIKKMNIKKTRFTQKWTKARQRLWAKEKFDDKWID